MIYAVVIEDRHTDVEIHLHLTLGGARVDAAATYLERRDREIEDEIIEDHEQQYPGEDDLWYYSTEGDTITIQELEDPKRTADSLAQVSLPSPPYWLRRWGHC
jgi:hypothetical protein